MSTIYVGTVTNRSGRITYKTVQAHETREAAARECFENMPKARTCSTSLGKREVIAGRSMIFAYHKDIRWHSRADIMSS